jgi:leucyl aminopeptidase
MKTRWRTLTIIAEPSEASAELVFVSGTPWVCHGHHAHRERVLQAVVHSSFSTEPGHVLDLLGTPDGSPRVLVLGIDCKSTETESHWLSIGGFIVEAMKRHRLQSVCLPAGNMLGDANAFEAVLLGALLHGFSLEKASGVEKKEFCPESLIVAKRHALCAESARRTADAVNRARAWVEQPANLLTPPIWSEEARAILVDRGAVVSILGPEELEKLGAGALLAVARGSEHGARLFIAEWRGDASRDNWDAVIVGKGLTFDAGGLNLKSRPNISKMKLDMAAGAGVLGALELAIMRGSRANVVAIVPMAENSIDALAFRPGDVVTSLSGITIEVADTDAEGRLVLADAMTYGIRNYKPRWIVDAATLTSMIMNVLHEEFAATYASDDQLANKLVAAGEAVGERLWRMPLDPSQDYLVESEIADLSNWGPPGFFGNAMGSPATGAKFLEKFTRGTSWAHIDMCGTAWSTRRTTRGNKGATGFGVRLLDRWLRMLEADNAKI